MKMSKRVEKLERRVEEPGEPGAGGELSPELRAMVDGIVGPGPHAPQSEEERARWDKIIAERGFKGMVEDLVRATTPPGLAA